MCCRAWLTLALLVVISGCGSDPTEEGSEPDPSYQYEASAQLTPNAKLLDAESASALSDLESDEQHVTLTFEAATAQIRELASDDVLIVGVTEHTPHGALVTVDEVEPVDTGVVVQAHRAALTEAFAELHVHLQAALATDPQTITMPETTLRRLRQGVGEGIPISIPAGSDSAGVLLEGSFALDPKIDFTLDIDIAELELDELSLGFSATQTFTATLTGYGQASFDRSRELAKIPGKTLTLLIPVPGIGTIPLVITSGITITAGVKGSIVGDASVGVTQRAGFSAGLGYKDGEFQAFSDDDSEADVDDPAFEGAASVRAWAGPKLEVLVYGLVGPYAGVEAFAEASASVEGVPPCITGAVDVGLSATAGVEFVADYKTTLFEGRSRLAGFDSCDPELDGPDAATTWSRTYARQGSDGDRAQAVIQVSDGGYFLVGESNLFDGVKGFAAANWVLRLDALGNVLWQRAFQRVAQGLARAAAEVPGGFIVAGTTGLLRLDSGGNLLWAKEYSTETGLEIMSLAPRDDGSVLLAGVLGVEGRALAMLVDARGDVVWAQSFAGQDLRHVRTTADGGALLAGTHPGKNGDFYLVRLDADGAVLWQRALDNFYDGLEGVEDAMPQLVSSGDSAYDAIEKPDGGLVVVGESYGNFPIPEAASGGYYASAVLELDANGEIVTSSVYRAPEDGLYGAAYGALVRPNGSTLVVARGAKESTNLLVDEDVLLLQDGAFSLLDGGGNDYVYSGTLSGVGRGMPLGLTRDGGAILAVTSNSFAGQDEVWLLKLSRTGSIASPYRRNAPGTSYVNSHATSFELDLPATDVDVTTRTFTPELGSEVTPFVSGQQTP